MNYKKIVAMGLAMIMGISIVTGCGKKQTDSAASSNASSQVQTDTEAKDQSDTDTSKDTSKDTTDKTASQDKEEESGFTYADLKGQSFTFCSGVGAWYTNLDINEDGSFEGDYHDTDMGDTGDGYPNGTTYVCNFSGKFSQLEKVDEYTYKMKIDDISYKETPGVETIEDGIKYVYSEAYGLDNPKDLYIYLPGKPVADLSEEYLSWARMSMAEGDTTLSFYGIYNENSQEGFVGYEASDNSTSTTTDSSNTTTSTSTTDSSALDTELANVAQQAADLENRLATEDLTQSEMNDIAAQIYNLWDNELNSIWSQLKTKLDSAAMKDLTTEEKTWISNKESEVTKAGADYEGGSMQPMVENTKAAELTKARVYELADKLR